MSTKKLHIGTSGWLYKHWSGTFYPEGLKAADRFAYYQKFFDTVELNNPFYRLPVKETFVNWKNEVSDEFLYSVKASRFITHMKKLRDPAESIARFMENVSGLGEKLGVILFQLPPRWNINADRLAEFLVKLPKGIRYTFEFRDHSWYDERIYKLLRKHNCAFCIYDLEQHLSPLEVTADFVYVRLHGPKGKYDGSYDDASLEVWASRINEWLKSRDVFVYFDNDIGTNAPFDAQRLMKILDFRF